MPEASPIRRLLAPFHQLFEFGGRTRRADYWPFMLFLLGIYVLGFIFTVFALRAGLGLSIAPGYAVTGLVALLACAATVRRLHDVSWSGGWVVAYLIMLLGFIAFFFYWRYGVTHEDVSDEPSLLFRFAPVLMIVSLVMNGTGLLIFVLAMLDGTPGPNRYGDDPKGRSSS